MKELLAIIDEFTSRPQVAEKYRLRLLELRGRLVGGDVSVLEEVREVMNAAVLEPQTTDVVELLDRELSQPFVLGTEYYSGGDNDQSESKGEDHHDGSDEDNGGFGYIDILRPSDSSRGGGESIIGEGSNNEGGSSVNPKEDVGVDKENQTIVLDGLSFEEDALSSRFTGISPLDLIGQGEDEEIFLEEDGRIAPPIRLDDHLELLQGDLRKVAGVDIGNYGDDLSVIIVRHGPHVIDVQRHPHRDVMELCGLIIKTIDEFNLDEVVLDATGGLGAAVYARLCEVGIDGRVQLTQAIGNAQPRDPSLRALNCRAEMYLLLKERFKKGNISIPMDKELYKAIASIRYKIMSDGGQFRILPKEEIKKIIGRSPDEADALALCFYSEVPLEVY